jgi:hypothetical protein
MRLSTPRVRDLDLSGFPDDFVRPTPVRRVFKRRGWLLALLVVTALLPRLVMAWKVDILTEDGPIYVYAAMQLERGNWEAAFRDGNLGLNLYPVVLEGLHGFGLPWELAGRLWGTLMATLVVLPMFGWVRRQFNDQIGVVACLLYAAHPGLIERSPEMLRCPSFWLLFMAALYFLWQAFFHSGRTLPRRDMVFAGALDAVDARTILVSCRRQAAAFPGSIGWPVGAASVWPDP